MPSIIKIPLILLTCVFYHASQRPPDISATLTTDEQKKASTSAEVSFGERIIPYTAPMGTVSDVMSVSATYVILGLLTAGLFPCSVGIVLGVQSYRSRFHLGLASSASSPFSTNHSDSQSAYLIGPW